ncbi:hypothetical protein [Streptomyces pseudovenezuelae]|uniref:hypothetical protein n=1 Tax=Streptomyces pseudovenezuelae TaxID=67350 RepID=UPI002472F7F9|nr:hypothetical protein [Streptomyces pseudovenezuelae]
MDGFAYVPEPLTALVPEGLVTHSSHHDHLAKFVGRDVLVVDAGQSAQESAALLSEARAWVQLLVRGGKLVFGTAATPPPHWQPDTGWAGPGGCTALFTMRRRSASCPKPRGCRW